MGIIFNYFVFPGFLFAACVGLLAGWVDRKVTARVQWRKGPPWHQNFVDIIKLFYKETILPEGARSTFLLAPYAGLLSAALVSAMLGRVIQFPKTTFAGDIIVVVYLLMIPALSLIIGAFSSRNPLASIGASREMKLIMGYELPFILSVIVVIIKSGGAIGLGNILIHQIKAGSNLMCASGAIAFAVSIICMQAKLCFVPFDASEAEQEIMAGALIEYSGPLLAVFKLTKAVLLYTMPVFLIILFWAGNMSPFYLIVKYAVLLVIIILIKNTNPRLRIDQALRFFWGPVAALALAAVILAIFGL